MMMAHLKLVGFIQQFDVFTCKVIYLPRSETHLHGCHVLTDYQRVCQNRTMIHAVTTSTQTSPSLLIKLNGNPIAQNLVPFFICFVCMFCSLLVDPQKGGQHIHLCMSLFLFPCMCVIRTNVSSPRHSWSQ